MGIDVEFCATFEEPLSEKEIVDLAWVIQSRFSQWVIKGETIGPLCVEKPEKYDRALFFDDRKIAQVIEVISACRYYGEDYERGPILPFIAMAEQIEFLYPSATCWYGGDCGIGIGLFDPAAREKIKRHFYTVGHEPYHSGRYGEKCPVCQNALTHRGWSGGKLVFACVLHGYFTKKEDEGELVHSEDPFKYE